MVDVEIHRLHFPKTINLIYIQHLCITNGNIWGFFNTCLNYNLLLSIHCFSRHHIQSHQSIFFTSGNEYTYNVSSSILKEILGNSANLLNPRQLGRSKSIFFSTTEYRRLKKDPFLTDVYLYQYGFFFNSTLTFMSVGLNDDTFSTSETTSA